MVKPHILLIVLLWIGTGCTNQINEYHIAVIASGQSRLVKLDGLRDGFVDRGYIIGETIHIRLYDAGNDSERLPPLIAEALATEPDVLVTLGGIETQAARRATTSLPIVFIGTAYTVDWGVVDSIREPGANLTGIDNGYVELTGKRLEWASRLLPDANHMTVLYSPGIVPSEAAWDAASSSAGMLDITVEAYPITVPPQQLDLVTDFTNLDTDALVIVPSYLVENALGEVTEASVQANLPLVGLNNDATSAGAVLSYGATFYDMGYQASGQVDKVLRGIQPANIPVEFPDRPKLTINMAAVDALNLTLPLDLLSLADEVMRP